MEVVIVLSLTSVWFEVIC